MGITFAVVVVKGRGVGGGGGGGRRIRVGSVGVRCGRRTYVRDFIAYV